MPFDITRVKSNILNNQFEKRIDFLKKNKKSTQSIENTVEATIKNLFDHKAKSFVIYGEPQSGKTELMIALTAKLLDKGIKHILVLINDNISLLNQNLNRFISAGLQPVPIIFKELEKTEYDARINEFVVFCKKNPNDLRRFRDLVGDLNDIFIIDDEGDYATPNSKINKNIKSPINELIGKILGNNGTFIAVTATPARIDLNNTFYNDNQKWVPFAPHPKYYGQENFFPSNLEEEIKYKINWLTATGDDPGYLRDAFFRFLITVADKNLKNQKNNREEEHFSFLVHTSGKIHDHATDEKTIRKAMAVIHQKKEPKYKTYLENIYNICESTFGDDYAYKIISYIKDHINRHKIVIMNSKKDMTTSDFQLGVNPVVPFTVCIGGNVVSRGVTFENLLSMYFTRDVKGKLQSDTYIQRARMFGNRENVFDSFELSITPSLYQKWWEAFLLHRVDLSSITGLDAPTWLSNKNIKVIAPSSIDRVSVEHSSGERGFSKFKFSKNFENIYNEGAKIETLKKISDLTEVEILPKFLLDFIKNYFPSGDRNIYFQNIRSITSYTTANHEEISRERGGLIDPVKDDKILHYFAVFTNKNNEARLFYKPVVSISFLKRPKK